MLKSLRIKGFTTFSEVEFHFSPGVNVVIGENGAGKSHLLKLAYSLSAVSHAASKEKNPPSKATLQKDFAAKLIGVFRPDKLGRLVRSHRARGAVGGRSAAEIELKLDGKAAPVHFTFSSVSEVEVKLAGESTPKEFLKAEPIFIPTKEAISLFPGFAALYRGRELSIDETYYDLCVALDASPLRGPRLDAIKLLLDPIEERLGGTVIRKGDSFYLDSENGITEMPLVAEGVRKIATLAHLLRNGALTKKGLVFWDEPESNLNPRLIRAVAAMLLDLASQGIQVILATHSFFLMKELELLRSQSIERQKTPTRFMTLALNESGDPVFEQANSLKEVTNIVALDEELAQYDRELQGT
mgnify:CR=1 FL=1